MEDFKNFELLLLEDGNSKPITKIGGKYYNTSLDSESVKGYKDGAEHFSLYLLSNEEVKYKEWCIDETNTICKYNPENPCTNIGIVKKIIASSNISLDLPKFSYDAITSIVTALNTNINLVGINVKVNKEGNLEINHSNEIKIKNLISIVNQ